MTWQGAKTHLHATWDTQMVEQAAGGGNTTAVLTAFASKLEAAIDNGSYSSQKASWISCANIKTAVRADLSEIHKHVSVIYTDD